MSKTSDHTSAMAEHVAGRQLKNSPIYNALLCPIEFDFLDNRLLSIIKGRVDVREHRCVRTSSDVELC